MHTHTYTYTCVCVYQHVTLYTILLYHIILYCIILYYIRPAARGSCLSGWATQFLSRVSQLTPPMSELGNFASQDLRILLHSCCAISAILVDHCAGEIPVFSQNIHNEYSETYQNPGSRYSRIQIHRITRQTIASPAFISEYGIQCIRRTMCQTTVNSWHAMHASN